MYTDKSDFSPVFSRTIIFHFNNTITHVIQPCPLDYDLEYFTFLQYLQGCLIEIFRSRGADKNQQQQEHSVVVITDNRNE